ncbi:hypothetical protein HHI36_015457 [Cryptolaemus montrouzieri]|uniref:Uncharacterized protein n=1 Tax=Cryptolaemus montrouzieri TaxID=559131 RepID=A0ABD2N5Q7_9CUCU
MAMRFDKDIQVSASSSSSSRDSSNMDEADYMRIAEIYIREYGKTPPRPPHLKGKQIGLWYSKVKRLRKTIVGENLTNRKPKVAKPVGDITLTECQRNDITNVLQNLPDRMSVPFDSDKSYENISDSRFKREFCKILKVD